MSYVKKYIRKDTKNSFVAIIKDSLINDYGLMIDEDGDISTSELVISDSEICVATMLHNDKELQMYFVDGRTKSEKIKVLFSVEYLADEMLGQRF